VKFEFIYYETIEGAAVSELEGYAILARTQASDLDWTIEDVVLYGYAWSEAKKRADRVEVTLPEKHPIALKLKLWLLSDKRREIDDWWQRRVHHARAERVEVL
jgi:hypothetical protein